VVAGKNIGGRVLISKVGEALAVPCAKRFDVPMKRTMDIGVVSVPITIFFISKKAGDLIVWKKSGDAEKGFNISLSY
jgi:hypothetical protein